MKHARIFPFLLLVVPSVSWTIPNAKTISRSRKNLIYNTDKIRLSTTTLFSDNDDEKEMTELEKAMLLKQKAEWAREDAKLEEIFYTQKKIGMLEVKLETQTKLSESEKEDIQNKIDSLKRILDPPPEGEKEEEENETGLSLSGPELEGLDKREFVEELSQEELDTLQEFESVFNKVRDLANVTRLTDLLEDDEINDFELFYINELSNVPNFVSKLVSKDGMKSLAQEAADDKEHIEEIKELLKDDPFYLKRVIAVIEKWGAFNGGYRAMQEDVDELVQNTLLNTQDIFKMTSKPRRVNNLYLIKGRSLAENGNDLIERLDKELASNNATLNDRIKIFYVKDPTEMVDLVESEDMVAYSDAMQSGSENPIEFIFNYNNLAPPALLVVSTDALKEIGNKEFKDATNIRGALTVAAILATIIFSSKCYGADAVAAASPSLLLIGGLLSLNLVHELGHFAAAALNKLEYAYLPCLLPAPDTGILTSFNKLKTPAKSNKELFDFAFSGPLLGFIASWCMLVYGLEQTAMYTKTDVIAALPHVPLNFLQLSPLTSATTESVLGIDVLLSLDPTSDIGIAVHPLVIAGHIGILINALELLPAGASSSDGIRMMNAVLPVPSIQVIGIEVVLGLYLLYQSWATRDISLLLFAYTCWGFFDSSNDDTPPRNEVEPAGMLRTVVFTATSIVALACLPDGI